MQNEPSNCDDKAVFFRVESPKYSMQFNGTITDEISIAREIKNPLLISHNLYHRRLKIGTIYVT